jgi:hypothetical protein
MEMCWRRGVKAARNLIIVLAFKSIMTRKTARKWNLQPPRQAEPFRKIVSITRNGKPWTASYHIADGQLQVDGAWGSRREPVPDPTDSEAITRRARALLADILAGRFPFPFRF